MLTLKSQTGQLHCQLLGDRQPPLQDVELDLQEELVAGDLLDEAAGVGGIELDPEVQGHGADVADLLGDPLHRVEPVLKNGRNISHK